MDLKIKFIDFWPDFDEANNLITSALKKQYGDDLRIVENGNDYDICYCSIFGKERYKHGKRILVLGENQRPDYRFCEYSLSCDYDSYCGKNFYLPLWLFEYDIFGDNCKATLSYREFLGLRSPRNYSETWLTRRDKICAIFNNYDLGRINKLADLLKSGLVDGYGRYFGKTIAGGYRSKIRHLENYKFHFCTENSTSPGYITEKLMHAYAAGCIPIYDCQNDHSNCLNRKCMIDLSSMDSKCLLSEMVSMMCNKDKMMETVNQPLLTTQMTKEDVYKTILKPAMLLLGGQSK